MKMTRAAGVALTVFVAVVAHVPPADAAEAHPPGKQGASIASARENLTENVTKNGWCFPGMQCKDFDCCALGSSCNTCPNGFETNNYDCALHGNRMCKGASPAPGPGPPAPSPAWCMPGSNCGPLDCCAWGSSCNTCPNGYFTEHNDCAGKGDRMCNTVPPGPGPSCDHGTTVPPQGNCKQTLLESKGWDMCVMVDGRADLPTVKADAKYDVYFMRAPIIGSSAEQRRMAVAFALFHSVILIQEKCAGSAARETFAIEFDAINFDGSLVIPGFVGGQLAWNNKAVVGWYKNTSEEDWSSPDAKNFIGGDISGSVVNAWLDEVPKWYETNPNYEVWSDFQASYGDPTPLFHDNQCHEFAEWSLHTLYYKGADFSSNTAPICRNYVPLVGSSYVTPVNISDPKVFADVASFYQNLGTYAQQAMKDPNDKGQALKTWIASYKQWYLINPNHTQYYHADLDPPFLAADKRFLMRPMMLPWQNRKTFVYGTCTWRGLETEEPATEASALVMV